MLTFWTHFIYKLFWYCHLFLSYAQTCGVAITVELSRWPKNTTETPSQYRCSHFEHILLYGLFLYGPLFLSYAQTCVLATTVAPSRWPKNTTETQSQYRCSHFEHILLYELFLYGPLFLSYAQTCVWATTVAPSLWPKLQLKPHQKIDVSILNTFCFINFFIWPLIIELETK